MVSKFSQVQHRRYGGAGRLNPKHQGFKSGALLETPHQCQYDLSYYIITYTT